MSIANKTKITVFTQTGCQPCVMLKEWLNEETIQFEEKNIKEDPQARKEFDDLGLAFTPFSYIQYKGEEHTVPGAAIERFKEILAH
ncbi:glutaredoxin family protein [Lysinibacillus sp. FSL H8-0500]|uniref:glutaredoxin family protein n=1 Tax=Lysinibacillus sp. FSL H8-0500 TaxID=2921393 RepID=UPI003101A02B